MPDSSPASCKKIFFRKENLPLRGFFQSLWKLVVKFLSWEILHPQQVTIKVHEAQGKKARAREDNCDWFLSSINTKFDFRFGRYVTSYHLIFNFWRSGGKGGGETGFSSFQQEQTSLSVLNDVFLVPSVSVPGFRSRLFLFSQLLWEMLIANLCGEYLNFHFFASFTSVINPKRFHVGRNSNMFTL